MKKRNLKGFISIFVLVILLILSVTITFLYTQNQNMSDYADDLYNKKKAQYMAESMLNIYLEKHKDEIAKVIIDDYMENKDNTKPSTRVLTDKLSNNTITYNGIKKYIKMTYIADNRKEAKDINGLYTIFINGGVDIDNSKADSQVYIKVINEERKPDSKDKLKLKIVIKQTY